MRINTASDVKEYVDRIEDMLNDKKYNFAEDTLSSILEMIQERNFITEGQKKAIDNIFQTKN